MITVDPKRLLAPLRAVCAAAPKKHAMPMLSHLHMEYGGDSLRLTGSDTETTIATRVPAECSAEGKIALPAHKLWSITDSAKDTGPIKINITEAGHAAITAGRARFRLATLPAEDYPLLEAEAEKTAFALQATELHKIIQRTQSAQGNNDVRYYLNGTLLHLDGNMLRAVATDGHRLHLAETAIEGKTQQQIIVPRKAVEAMHRLPTEGALRVQISERWIAIEIDDIRLHAKLIDGKYPDYNKVIPNCDSHACTVDTDTLLNAIQRCAIVSDDKYPGIKLQFSTDTIRLDSSNPDSENATDEISAEYSGPDSTIGANVNYLVDALRNIDAHTVVLHVPTDSGKPTVIEPPEDKNRLALIMPMRL